MLRSMFSGVSGLRMHQTRMDVIGNNIANVNTVAYKSSRVTFNDVFSQTLQSASAPLIGTTGRGGTNPYQVGLGVTIGSVDVLHTNSGSQRTDKATDLAIEGSGFFTVSDGINRYYTRAGNFDLDAGGNLVTPSGLQVQGWLFDPVSETIPITGEPSAINLSNLVLPPKATENVLFEGNLDNRMDIDETSEYLISIYDAKGTEHSLKYTFTKIDENVWEYTVTADPSLTIVSGGNGTLVFDTEGHLDDANCIVPATTIDVPGTEPIVFQPEFNSNKFTEFAQQTSVNAANIDGYKAGVLNGISFDNKGNIIGSYSNGYFRIEGTLAITQFTNPVGLEKMGDNLYRETSNSGRAEYGLSGQDGRGTINPRSLEMSNVDLAREFTDMIATQRGFQANSRIITTSDEMLLELVNLKR